MKTLAIIIPAHNEAAVIGACLRAIQRQTVQPDEVIVVDNNSTDKTAKIARKFDNVKVVAEPRPGIAHARNAGFNAASADILARIDADTELPVDWVAAVHTRFESSDSPVSGKGFFSNMPLPRIVGAVYFGYAKYATIALAGYQSLWGSSMAITAEQWAVVKDKVSLRRDVHEDLDLAYHLHIEGYDPEITNLPVVEVELRRVLHDRGSLWGYFLMLPRTFRVNGHRLWWAHYFTAVIPGYILCYVLVLINRLRPVK